MEQAQSSRRAPLAQLQLDSLPDTNTTSSLMLETARNVHTGLWLDKYINGLGREDTATHTRLVAEVASIPIPAIYQQFYARWQQNLEMAQAKSRKYYVKSRLAVGLGNEGVLETSVALHRTYGVPYIPGSALKGLAATYARLMAGEEWQSGKSAYEAVFGNTKNAGFITFFDALYIPAKLRLASPAQSDNGPDCPLRADIITVHHPAYYQEKKDQAGQLAPPADWDSPNPVPFLSATGHYLIALAAPDLDNGNLWIEKVFEILEEALLVLGVGAKTSSGYGRMKITSQSLQSVPPGIKIAEGYKREIGAVKDIPSQMFGYYQQWQRLETDEARKIVALAIVEKIAETHSEKWASKRSWYQELQAFLK